MQDLSSLISFAEAAKHLPGNPAVSTLHRWRAGLGGIRLWSVRIGGRRYTTLKAIREFGAATTAAADRDSAQTKTPP